MPRRRKHSEHKGISLPINMIVILSIAVLVLVVVAAYFIGVFGRSGNTIGGQDAWNRGCGMAQARGCPTADFAEASAQVISGYNPDGDADNDNLFTACQAVYGTTTDAKCRTNCCG